MATFALIPGLLSDKMVWETLAEMLSAGAIVHNADLRDCASISAMACSVLQATDGPLVAVGHSMGGRVAMEMAHLSPERICGLVLADTGHRPRRQIKRQAMIDLGYKSMRELADTWLPQMVNPGRVDDPELLGRLRSMVLRADAGQHERHIKALIDRPDATSYLGEIGCPILLITGRQDSWSPIAQHQEIADAMANSTLKIIEDAGHFAPVERPGVVADIIIEWLRTLKDQVNILIERVLSSLGEHADAREHLEKAPKHSSRKCLDQSANVANGSLMLVEGV